MTASPSQLNEDVADIWNRACDDPEGVRVRFATKADATHFRARLHAFRRDAQSDARQVYPSDHPAHGKTLFDEFVCKLRDEDDCWYVYVERKPHIVAEALSEMKKIAETFEITPERKVAKFTRRFG